MTRFLIDENLPYYFSLWDNEKCEHVYDLETIKTDSEIWSMQEKTILLL